ncbi:MAG: glycosyltransferase [Anaerolineae bacterium]|nr:glycosyltransferase [Anaerolineae bacterium]MDQ7036530.1 glycosyltransferase [Anaerolineae bacterium]
MMTLLTILYGLCALLLAVYTLGHGMLLLQYLRHRNHKPSQPQVHTLPTVTVQVPIYNERHVAIRLVQAIACLDYPADKLCIQILDDSSDSTSALIAQHIRRYPNLEIVHIRRSNRVGYKAGALADGLSRTDSRYVAIFDADFIPPRDFLQRTIPFLEDDDSLGVVQTRWGHLNPDDNWLTRAQVLSIDTHFLIEQTGRNRSGWILPFNGTGGVWRTATIHDAGGWSDATLTEDLDLSFRAQIRGWHSLMLPQIVVPGELPPQLAAYRQQQARWAKGSSQCLRRLIIPVWQSDLKMTSKLIATQHLAQYIPHVLMLLMLLLMPILLLSDALYTLPLAPLGFIGLIPLLMYVVSQYDSSPHWRRRLLAFPALLLIGTGMIWNNSRAVISGIFSTHSEFRRTPKFVQAWTDSDYAIQVDSGILVEFGLMIYALWGIWIAWQTIPALIPYFLIHALSFATVITWDAIDQWRIARTPLIQANPTPESAND